jgi:hypothetical protein
MHPDLLVLLEADDEAKQRVAEAGRRLQERVRAARLDREADENRLQEQRAQDVDQLVRSIDDVARRRTEERAASRSRLRLARAAATERALAAGIDAYLRIVRGGSGSEHEP